MATAPRAAPPQRQPEPLRVRLSILVKAEASSCQVPLAPGTSEEGPQALLLSQGLLGRFTGLFGADASGRAASGAGAGTSGAPDFLAQSDDPDRRRLQAAAVPQATGTPRGASATPCHTCAHSGTPCSALGAPLDLALHAAAPAPQSGAEIAAAFNVLQAHLQSLVTHSPCRLAMQTCSVAEGFTCRLGMTKPSRMVWLLVPCCLPRKLAALVGSKLQATCSPVIAPCGERREGLAVSLLYTRLGRAVCQA